MDGKWISIAAYFNINGIKVSKLSRPIIESKGLFKQLDRSYTGVVMTFRDGSRHYFPIPDFNGFNKLGVTKEQNGELK